ncbi:hypothetical protein O1611_g5962 [Lasiodiplodia mahajangana]|uniref:Uncharacterized protein n=1 Tax=Lasiodiplodia mahajangana TaxID=1108764 RepID=A0ACC2JK22_9PEZI|nr:hypothetical protein O1611_g5962 [Lasiodiplodia mahajangana]
MANSKQAQEDILALRGLIGSVLTDMDGRLYINSMARVPAVAEAGLPLRDRNVCQIIAALPDDTLSDFVIEGKHGRLPHLDLSRLTVEHKILGGECMCFLKLSNGNLSDHLRALRRNCERLTINLSNVSPLLQFILLCRLALRLPLPGRFGLLRVGHRFNDETWLDAGNETNCGEDLSLSLHSNGPELGATQQKDGGKRRKLEKSRLR